jgi:hypothetical protein
VSFCVRQTMPAARVIASALPTEVPPNFIVIVGSA